ncbi:unnamed protein product, partial [Medioppia subpectinata]
MNMISIFIERCCDLDTLSHDMPANPLFLAFNTAIGKHTALANDIYSFKSEVSKDEGIYGYLYLLMVYEHWDCQQAIDQMVAEEHGLWFACINYGSQLVEYGIPELTEYVHQMIYFIKGNCNFSIMNGQLHYKSVYYRKGSSSGRFCYRYRKSKIYFKTVHSKEVFIQEKFTQEKLHSVDSNELYGCLTMDVIANCAFATKTNAFKNPNNAFVVNERNVLKLSVLKLISMLLLPQFVLNILKFKTLLNEKSVEFFSTILRQILRVREKSEAKSNDLIDLMMRAKEGKDNINDESDGHESHHINEGEEELEITNKILNIKPSNKFITEDEMIAQMFIVLLAGYETTATTLAFCSYELALNPDVQQKLYEEVMSSMDTNGEIGHEVLTKLPLLDAVIAETLRLHTPLVIIGRYAAEDYRLGSTGITVYKGQALEIPVYAIHHSREYYPNPEMFIPDRFLPENRHKIIPYTYLPFGSGPRNCIGMRFALMEAKLGLARIIRRVQLTRSPRTDIPLILLKNPALKSVKSIIVGIQYRD